MKFRLVSVRGPSLFVPRETRCLSEKGMLTCGIGPGDILAGSVTGAALVLSLVGEGDHTWFLFFKLS